MKLHQNKELFRQAIQFTAQQMQIPDIYIEKDYWILYALQSIFTNLIGKDVVFKGGTSLSKCFNLIERFSEDIDLVILKQDAGLSNNQLTNKINRVGKIVSEILPEIQIDGITNKKGMIRKTAHTYAKEFSGNYGQVRDVIIVEASWLGSGEPYSQIFISSYIYEMMINTGQELLAKDYGLQPFEVSVLSPKRTICEKIMSLVRFSYTDNPIESLKQKIRHCYDLHQLLQNIELLEFFNSDEFEVILLKVASDDIISFKNNNAWLEYHPRNAKIFLDIESIWSILRLTYNEDFKNLVFGNFPKDTEILKTLLSIKDRLSTIIWNINKLK